MSPKQINENRNYIPKLDHQSGRREGSSHRDRLRAIVHHLQTHLSSGELNSAMATPDGALSDSIRMAILDDYQNLSESLVKEFSSPKLSITVFKDTIPPSEESKLISRLHPFNVISTMRERTRFPASVVQKLPNLRLLLTTGHRNAALDLPAFKAASVIVAGTNHSSLGSATTQHIWALVLALADNIPRDDLALKTGGAWQDRLPLTTYLAGLTFGSLGLGNFGLAASKIAVQAFGMRVLAWSSSLTQEKADAQAERAGLPPGSFQVAESKAALFENADVLSVHYVLSERSRGIVGREDLARLKKSALFVNTSRGGLVEEDALFETLDEGRITGAALDVFWEEPTPEDSRWRTTKWGRENGRSEVVMTPHTAYVAASTMDEWWKQTGENLGRWLKGEEVLNRMN